MPESILQSQLELSHGSFAKRDSNPRRGFPTTAVGFKPMALCGRKRHRMESDAYDSANPLRGFRCFAKVQQVKLKR